MNVLINKLEKWFPLQGEQAHSLYFGSRSGPEAGYTDIRILLFHHIKVLAQLCITHFISTYCI